MREQGHDVPLELIAERAGITRGTLYRNFVDRADLFRAVLDDEISALKNEIRTDGSLGIFVVMRRLIEVSDLYHAFASSLQSTADPAEACSPADLLRDVISIPLAAAKADGVVRPTLTEAEVLLACRMVAFGWRLDGEHSRAEAIDKRLRLVVMGFGTDREIEGPAKPA